MKVFLKIHVRNDIETVAACDEELLNQVFMEGDLRIEISNHFFGGDLMQLEEAIDIWINLEHDLIPKIENPTDQLSGLLKGVTQTSVELQHLGKDLFIKG